jgi:hypothetical protein
MDTAEQEISDEDVKAGTDRDKLFRDAFAWNWAERNPIDKSVLILPDGEFETSGREYLHEPMNCDDPYIVVMKGTQGGYTVCLCVVKSIHACIHGIYPKGVIVAMPTDTDVQTMAKTKWNPMIAMNPKLIGRFIQSGGKGGTDSADLKKIGNSFIYFLSTQLKRNESGEKTSSNLKSRSCDVFYCDEFDNMDSSVLEMLRGRYADSKIKHERIISNPLSENSGSHVLFQQSTQKYWHRLCPYCGKYTCPDKEFFIRPEKIITPACVNGLIHCVHCHRLIPMYWADLRDPKRKQSCYIADYKDRKWTGFHWSHLNSVRSNAWDILQDFQNPPEGNLGDVMRNKLGRPYTSKEDQLKDADVRACCGREPMLYGHNGPCVMGVDVMKIIHYVIGSRVSRETYEIYKAGTCQDFKELYDIAKRFNIKTAGIDVAPDIHAAKEFQKILKALKCRAYLVDYKTSKAVGVFGFDDVNMIIKANRTEVMDMTHNIFINKKITLPRQEYCEELIKQICDPFKIQTKNEKTGLPEFRYKGSVDHFRHSINYFVLAGQKAPVVSLRPDSSKKLTCDNNYKRI